MEDKKHYIDEHLLEFEDDALVFNEVPFTGISLLNYSSGQRKSESSYREGFPEGLCQEWHENGQLHKQWIAVRASAPAEMTEWFDNGLLKSKRIFEHGVELEYSEWDLSEKLVVSRKLIENSEMHNFLKIMRNLKAKG